VKLISGVLIGYSINSYQVKGTSSICDAAVRLVEITSKHHNTRLLYFRHKHSAFCGFGVLRTRFRISVHVNVVNALERIERSYLREYAKAAVGLKSVV
jgi:hypothetical protein